MDELLRELLNALDIIGQDHEEIYDSDCRQLLGNAVFHSFIRPKGNCQCPENFGLFSESANQQVKIVLTNYIRKASQLAQELGLNTFHQRLAAFQNSEVQSDIERNDYDEFFGWSNPEQFDEEGNVIMNN